MPGCGKTPEQDVRSPVLGGSTRGRTGWFGCCLGAPLRFSQTHSHTTGVNFAPAAPGRSACSAGADRQGEPWAGVPALLPPETPRRGGRSPGPDRALCPLTWHGLSHQPCCRVGSAGLLGSVSE